MRERRSKPWIGIMQGRLSPPFHGQIQSFPWMTWEREFALARHCGFDGMEWIVDAEHVLSNPIFHDSGQKHIRELSQQWTLPVRSVCADVFMLHKLFDGHSRRRAHAIDLLERLIRCCECLGIETILIPLLEHSALVSQQDRDHMVETCHAVDDLLQSSCVTMAIESSWDAGALHGLMTDIGSNHVQVYYDIGNAVSYGCHPPSEIRYLGSYLHAVHIKDRTIHGPTCPLGEGDVPFHDTFCALRDIKFDGAYILQMARGPNDVCVAQDSLAFTREYLEAVYIKE